MIQNEMKMIKLLQMLKLYDTKTYEHSIRVGILMEKIKLKDYNIMSGYLHDVGKMFIPSRILNKKGKLTTEEYETIKMHTQYGFGILLDKGFPLDVCNSAKFHHEKLDGTGYYGLNNVSTNIQILSIVDAFDAMTMNRGYNKVKTKDEAIVELLHCTNQFNTKLVVDVFPEVIMI